MHYAENNIFLSLFYSSKLIMVKNVELFNISSFKSSEIWRALRVGRKACLHTGNVSINFTIMHSLYKIVRHFQDCKSMFPFEFQVKLQKIKS